MVYAHNFFPQGASCLTFNTEWYLRGN
jgi:hypothetical protein